MPPSRIDLPVEVRAQVCDLLNRRLADLIDLQLRTKQAHWNVRGSNFIGVHKMLDDLFEDVQEYVDEVAERIVQLGGIAMGTVQAVASGTCLEQYPTDVQDGRLHLEAMAKSIAYVTNELRTSLDTLDDLDEEVAEDILTGIARGLDKWLWFVSAHIDVQEESPAWKSKAASRKEAAPKIKKAAPKA